MPLQDLPVYFPGKLKRFIIVQGQATCHGYPHHLQQPWTVKMTSSPSPPSQPAFLRFGAASHPAVAAGADLGTLCLGTVGRHHGPFRLREKHSPSHSVVSRWEHSLRVEEGSRHFMWAVLAVLGSCRDPSSTRWVEPMSQVGRQELDLCIVDFETVSRELCTRWSKLSRLSIVH